ncbi:MAG: hypothetical protein V3W18_09425 [candidate division Zixibacteria bacterium]
MQISKRIVLIVLLVLPGINANSSGSAWEEKNDKAIIIKMGSVIIEGELGFNLALTTCSSISPEIIGGMGLSWEKSYYSSFYSLLSSARYNFAADRTSPFICGEIGYAIERVKGISSSITNGPMIGAGVGINAPARKRLDIFLEVSYKSQWSRRYLSYYYANPKSESVRFDMLRFNMGVAF